VESAGFEYDMTYGDNQGLGFRAGVCHPYHPLKPDGSLYSFLEIPTSYMDWTSLHAGMSSDDIVRVISKLKASVETLSGCLCVNFHNTYVDRELFPQVERAYSFLISECKSAGFWITTAKECASWWRRREKADLDAWYEDGKLRVKSSDPLVRPRVMWPDGRIESINSVGVTA